MSKQAMVNIVIIPLGSKYSYMGMKARKETELTGEELNKIRLYPVTDPDLRNIELSIREINLSLDPVSPHEVVYEATEENILGLKGKKGWTVDEY